MSESYEKNGYGGDFKRNAPAGGGGGGNQPEISEKAGDYLRELLSEKIKIEQAELPLTGRLINEEVVRVQSLGRIPQRDSRYVDIYREKPVKVTVKVLVPVNEHPKFNFVGKLLGPKGSSMKQLQEETMCKMAVLGRGSMKDREKEEELRQSLDPKYAHLSDDLHVEISALGPPAEAHARIAYALAEVRKYLIPDANDTIRQSQMRQMLERGAPGGPGMGRPAPHSVPPPPAISHPVMPAKTKIMSILDRARSAMEEAYPVYEEPYARAEPPVRASRPTSDYYSSYERPPPERHSYSYEESYYKPEREYKTASRDSGTRRGASGPTRYRTRESPYSRPIKEEPSSGGWKKY